MYSFYSPGSGDWDRLSGGICNGNEKSIILSFLTPDGGGVSSTVGNHFKISPKRESIHSGRTLSGC